MITMAYLIQARKIAANTIVVVVESNVRLPLSQCQNIEFACSINLISHLCLSLFLTSCSSSSFSFLSLVRDYRVHLSIGGMVRGRHDDGEGEEEEKKKNLQGRHPNRWKFEREEDE